MAPYYSCCHAVLLLLMLVVGSSSSHKNGVQAAMANAAGFTNGMRYIDVLNQNNIHDPHDSPSFSSWKTSGSQIVHVESGMPRDNDEEDDDNENDDEDSEEDTIDSDDSDDNHKHKHANHAKRKEYEDVQEHFLVQRLDHFAPSESQTFAQRYFYSDRFVSDDTTPPKKYQYAFLCCGGEGPALDQSVLVDSVHCTGDMVELAAILHKELDANVYMFGLEHRYYGKSYPSKFHFFFWRRQSFFSRIVVHGHPYNMRPQFYIIFFLPSLLLQSLWTRMAGPSPP